MKSIKQKISITMILTVTIFITLLGTISTILIYKSSIEQLRISMIGTLNIVADRVEQELIAYKNVATSFGTVRELSDPNFPIEQKKFLCEQWSKKYGFIEGNVFDAEGNSLFDGNNYSDREYFKRAIKGETVVSPPIKSRTTDSITVVIAAPLWENGIMDSKIVGIVLFEQGTFLNDIMNTIHISPNSGAYMIDSDGYTIADITMDTVNTQNIEKEAQNDSSLAELAKIHSFMRKGTSDFSTCKINNINKFIAYAPVNGTDNWSIAITTLQSDFMKSTINTIICVILFVILSIVIATFISLKISTKIANPIVLCVKRLNALSEGDLHSKIPEIDTQDETGILANATKEIVTKLKALIDEEKRVLGAMANGNFKLETEKEIYVGDLYELYNEIVNINKKLTYALKNIETSSYQVLAGAEQVSAGAQSLSQGATEQASSVQQMAATVNNISNEILETTEISKNARKVTEDAGEAIEQSYSKMQELADAMDNINTDSQEIKKIIKTIEDIAFQTNILALNAAVEAARAGTAGKGFAVVADEVRNLASKSSEASKNTAALIERSLESVSSGTLISTEAKNIMEQNREKVKQSVQFSEDIANRLSSQSSLLEQISLGIEQISSVVQTNSATAEQSAAASEELSSQADVMKKLINTFNLKDNNDF